MSDCQSNKLLSNVFLGSSSLVNVARGTREGAIAESIYALYTSEDPLFPTVANVARYLNSTKRKYIITTGYSVPTGAKNNKMPTGQTITYPFPVWVAPFYFDPENPRHEIGIAYSWEQAMDECRRKGGRLASKKGTAGFLNTVFRLNRFIGQGHVNDIKTNYPEIYYARGGDEETGYYPQCYDFLSALLVADGTIPGGLFDPQYDQCPDYMNLTEGSYICEYPVEVK